MKKLVSVLCAFSMMVLLFGNVIFAASAIKGPTPCLYVNNSYSYVAPNGQKYYYVNYPGEYNYRGYPWCINNGRNYSYNSPNSSYSYNNPSIIGNYVPQNAYNAVMEKGWHVDNVGKFYCKGDGNVYSNGWYWIDGRNYRFDARGYVYRNQWIKDNNTGSWYFVDADGGALIGWQKIDNVWYYFNPEIGVLYGAMARNTVMFINDLTFGVGFFAFNNDGAKITNSWYGGHYYDGNGLRVY